MHVAGVRFTTLFILTHIKRFFIVFRTNCWTDVVRCPLACRAGRLSLLLYSPAQDGKHIKCFPLRAELAIKFICAARLPRPSGAPIPNAEQSSAHQLFLSTKERRKFDAGLLTLLDVVDAKPAQKPYRYRKVPGPDRPGGPI